MKYLGTGIRDFVTTEVNSQWMSEGIIWIISQINSVTHELWESRYGELVTPTWTPTIKLPRLGVRALRAGMGRENSFR